MFLIKEERVIQRSSILLPSQNTAATSALSTLLFLITGNDFADADPREEKKIRLAKKAAVADYIRSRLASFAGRKGELDMNTADSIDLQTQVESVIEEITKIEARIADAACRNKTLLREIFSLNEQLAEGTTLHNRYRALKSQYQADIKRLMFIIEGENNKVKYPASAKCPFCDGDMRIQEEPCYFEAAHAELHKTRVQMQDLDVSESELVVEHKKLEDRITALNSKKQSVDDILNKELKPQAANLKRLLAEYRKTMEIQDEFAFISNTKH